MLFSADKLAALWPFLAIVAEVVILCIIIFIYEKRHTKAQEEDESSCQATRSVNVLFDLHLKDSSFILTCLYIDIDISVFRCCYK